MTPFRVLYRLFVFRLVDVELLSAHAGGDSNKLLGQIAALLIFISLFFSELAGAMTGERNAPLARLMVSWNAEHQFLATALLLATVLAPLSWDSFFPDRRDVMTLSPLPTRSSTVFLAKVAALVSAIAVLTAAFCAFPMFCYSVALAPASTFGILDIGTWAGAARSFLALGAAVAAACLLPVAVIAVLQSVGAAVLRRNLLLRVSGVLQIGLFALAVAVYFLAPPISQTFHGDGEWIPSQWLVGIFESMRGGPPAPLAPLARRGWICFALLTPVAAICYALSYLTVTRQIVEQPDVSGGVAGVGRQHGDGHPGHAWHVDGVCAPAGVARQLGFSDYAAARGRRGNPGRAQRAPDDGGCACTSRMRRNHAFCLALLDRSGACGRFSPACSGAGGVVFVAL